MKIKEFQVQETKRFFLILILVMVLSGINSSSIASTERVAGVSVSASAPAGSLPIAPDSKLPLLPVPVGGKQPPQVSARAVLVADRGSGMVLLEKNSGEKLPIASLTKLMTALVAEENSAPDQAVEIAEADIADVPEPRAGFVRGEKIRVSALEEAMLVSSANDAALALGRGIFGDTARFVSAMNAKAALLGMRGTSFANPVGFDDPQHFSTAADLALLVEEFLHHPALAEIVKKKSDVITSADGQRKHSLLTTNKLLTKYQEVIGLKTGYTAEARGNLIILVSRNLDDQKVQYYSILLGSANREAETDEILNWVKDNFQWR